MLKSIPLVNNAYIISLVGEPKHINKTEKEITKIIKSWRLSCESVSITPECLVSSPINEQSEWCVQLKNIIIKSSAHIIINKMSNVNSDAIIDFSRSVRAFSIYSFVNRHPWTFIVDPNVTNETKSESKLFKLYENSGQVNIYAGADTMENNKKNLEVYIKPMGLFE
jgi:hypothetical protein